MRWISYLLLVWAAVTFQALVAWRLDAGGARPDAVIVLVVWLALAAPRHLAGLAGWGVGLAQDTLSVGPAGLHALVYLGVAQLLAESRRNLPADTVMGQAALAGLVAWAVRLGEGVIGQILGQAAPVPVSGGPSAVTTLGWAIGDGLATTVMAVGVIAALSRLPTGWSPPGTGRPM